MSEDGRLVDTRFMVPWGKYSYELEGLAIGCHLEGTVEADERSPTFHQRTRPRLRFMVKLPTRCFVLSVALKLPDASRQQASVLDDVIIERAVNRSKYEPVFRGASLKAASVSRRGRGVEQFQDWVDQVDSHIEVESIGEEANAFSPSSAIDSHALHEAEVSTTRVLDIKRAADSLRICMVDVEEDDRDADTRVLGINVIGFVRGQSPGANRIETLLNCASTLTFSGSVADRIELDGLCGLAFLSTRRYYQAAELLHRAAMVTSENASFGQNGEMGHDWAAQLELLVAHASFEHTPMSGNGIVALRNVAKLNVRRKGGTSPTMQELSDGIFDLRTDLLVMLPDLINVLIGFLGKSVSLAVRMSAGRMIDFVIEQLGCAVSPYVSSILDTVLRTYRDCKPLTARERAAAISFPYDSMEDCYERLIDSCCRLLPQTEQSLVKFLFDRTILPLMLDFFDESEYLFFREGVEDECDERLCTAIAQTLRVTYLALGILEGDAHIPPSFLGRILNMIIAEHGVKRTPTLLRRSALHAFDEVLVSLSLSAKGGQISNFRELLGLEQEYLGKLIVKNKRPSFEYEKPAKSERRISVFAENDLVPEDDDVLKEVLKRRDTRTEVVDRFTLHRLLALIRQTCFALQPCASDAVPSTISGVLDLQEALAAGIADILMSSIIDIAYYEAALSGNGAMSANTNFEFGDIDEQLEAISLLLTGLFTCFWGALQLLPAEKASEAESKSPVKPILRFLIARCSQKAPPVGIWVLLRTVVVSLNHDLNKSMHKPSSDVTFVSILQGILPWLSQSSSSHPFELFDVLFPVALPVMSAADLVASFTALADQNETLQERASTSLGVLASSVAAVSPLDAEAARKSLQELKNPDFPEQRIVTSFPRKRSKSKSSSSSSFTKMFFTPSSSGPPDNPFVKSFHLHVVLASCFDKLDLLSYKSEIKGGGAIVGDLLDDFVVHAALLVRVLHACSRAGGHREYVRERLSDILGSALRMQDHIDGRVRLVGFEIFAASLDVLFSASKASVVLSQRPDESSRGAESTITELPPQRDEEVEGVEKSSEETESSPTAVNDLGSETKSEEEQTPRNDVIQKLEEGGTLTFSPETISASKLHFEESGWTNLCVFLKSTLGIGKYVDFYVQRAGLEYLKGSLLNSITHRSSGSSCITFGHIREMWDSVERVVGSPWRTLNDLSFYILLIIANVAIYSVLTPRSRNQTRHRQSQFDDFSRRTLFPVIEKCLRSSTREVRRWGARLLECYLRARCCNHSLLATAPDLAEGVLAALETLKSDWDAGLSTLAIELLEIRSDCSSRRLPNQYVGFTQSMRMSREKRTAIDEADSQSGSIELWFSAAPKAGGGTGAERFTRTLEAFANSEIEGGEEPEDYRGEEEEEVDGALSDVDGSEEPLAEEEDSDEDEYSGSDEEVEKEEYASDLVTTENGKPSKSFGVSTESPIDAVRDTTEKKNMITDGLRVSKLDIKEEPKSEIVLPDAPQGSLEIELERMPRSKLSRQGSLSKLPNLDKVSFGAGEAPKLSRRRAMDVQYIEEDNHRSLSSPKRISERDDSRISDRLASPRRSSRSRSVNSGMLQHSGSSKWTNTRTEVESGQRSDRDGQQEVSEESRRRKKLPRGSAFIKMNALSTSHVLPRSKSSAKGAAEPNNPQRLKLPRGRSSTRMSKASPFLDESESSEMERGRVAEILRRNSLKSPREKSNILFGDESSGSFQEKSPRKAKLDNTEEAKFKRHSYPGEKPADFSERNDNMSRMEAPSSGSGRVRRRMSKKNVLDEVEHYLGLVDQLNEAKAEGPGEDAETRSRTNGSPSKYNR